MENNNEEELDRFCYNCQSFFPAYEHFTEEGICLNDDVFEPYFEELLENTNYDPCRELIEQNKFYGDKEACDNFNPVDIEDVIEIPPEIAEKIQEQIDNKTFSKESFIETIYGHFFDKIDLKDISIDRQIEELNSNKEDEVFRGINTLRGLISQDNKKACNLLYERFKSMPPAKVLKDAHIKARMVEALSVEKTQEVVDCLVDELYRTPSYNTTRSLYRAIFSAFEKMPLELISDHFERMLKDKRFSYRFKNRMKEIIYEQSEEKLW